MARTRRPEGMIVRNLNDKEVLDTTYIAHGGAIAQMILDRRTLQEIGFLAIATLAPGKEIEAHVDPMEEIYFIASGSGEMRVDEERRPVGPGDAIWIPAGSAHSLVNDGDQECTILVVASPTW
jgi:mannose-6-phosphate isomerase-like protein (cupin superfamily)